MTSFYTSELQSLAERTDSLEEESEEIESNNLQMMLLGL